MKKKIEKMNTSISTFHFRLHNSTAHLSNALKPSREVLIPSETYHVQNIKSTNFILGTNTKSTNLYILIKPRKLIPMKYFHSI